MLNLIGHLPVELVGMNILSYLSLKDIVMLERACCSKKSHQQFGCCIPYCAPVALPSNKEKLVSVLEWFVKRRCKVKSLSIDIPDDNPLPSCKGPVCRQF